MLNARNTELAEERALELARRAHNAEAGRVRLMRALLAEVQENIAMRPREHQVIHTEYVVDMWGAVKGRAGVLPGEALDAVRDAYALSARYNSMAGWERLWGFEHIGAVVSIKAVHSDMVEKAGREAHESLEHAATMLGHLV